MRTLIYIFAITGILLFCGCSATRRVPQGSYMLTKNKIVEDRDVPKKERIRSVDVEKYIQTRTNRKFLGTNLYVRLYNLASSDSTNRRWINRTLRNWGEPAVLLDSSALDRSADLLHNYAQYSGYYNSDVWYEVIARKKRAKVKYHIEQNAPYRIGNISYDFGDELLRQVVMEDTVSALIHPGDVLDGNTLSAEKERVTRYLRNNGFYDFNQSFIEFFGDATADSLVKDVSVAFRQRVADYTSQGEPVYDNSSIYRISKIVINPQYDPTRAALGDEYYERMDTMEYRGLYILYPRGGKPKVRAEILRQAVNLYPNYLYDETEVRQVHGNIMRLGNYRSTDIIFEPVETDDDMIITFVSGDDDEDVLGQTTEKYLKCHINCIPGLRQGYKIELEGSTTSSFHAVRAKVAYQNRNFFRGAELFEVSFNGGYEFWPGKKGAFELGGTVSLSFPRFIVPFNIDRYNKAVNPRTKVEVSINKQNRRFYDRTLSGINWGYSWSNRGRSSYTIKPVDLNLVKMGSLDAGYEKQLQGNKYLLNSYKDQLIGGISGSYIFNAQQGRIGIGNSAFVFRLNAETAGNFLTLPAMIFSNKTTDSQGDRYYRIFGIRYAQYFRVDGSISDRIVLGPKTNIAFRLYGGVGRAYGNTGSLPFDRMFYAGGSNSMRGWLPRRLGPGNEVLKKPDGNDPEQPDESKYANQIADLKLEANAELRFPVWKMLHGAVFFDVGNIWFLKRSKQVEEATFKVDNFYKQLGFNTGIGMRFDVNVAVIRLDFGYRLHDPNQPRGKRWQDKLKIGRTVINFGVGYPF